jgi:hypothetical protein
MKRLALLAFLALALVFSTAKAHAAVIITTTIDEYGNGTASNGSTTLTLPTFFTGDPTGGVTGNILAYQLPFAVVQGDVIMTEPGFFTTVVLSDVVRFIDEGNVGFAIFYSDNGDGVDSLADISGLPVNTMTNFVTIPEVGPEVGPNGAVYTPTAGQPGFINSDFAPTYNILSDSTAPEPGSVLLIAAGLGGLGLLKRYRS